MSQFDDDLANFLENLDDGDPMALAKPVDPNDRNAAIERVKCITPEFRVSFPAMFEPKKFEGEGEAKYGVRMLFPKTTPLKDNLRRIWFAAMTGKFGPKEQWPKKYWNPFRDGDEEGNGMDGYAGHIFVSAKNKNPPGLVDQRRKAIVDPNAFYAGCYARAEVICYAFDNKMKGAAFSLQNVQKLRDGKPFSGRKQAEDVFDEVADTSDDEDSYDSDDSEDVGF